MELVKNEHEKIDEMKAAEEEGKRKEKRNCLK